MSPRCSPPAAPSRPSRPKKAGKCRFIGFTGHHDPEAHLAMLRAYDRWDSILMPLHVADPLYLSFEKKALPVAVDAGWASRG